jgi:hypothetical protein
MKKNKAFLPVILALAAIGIGFAGCATVPTFESLPEVPHPNAKAFIGSWIAENVDDSFEAKQLGLTGRKYIVTFYDDGTAETLSSGGERSVWKYRVTDTRLGVLDLKYTQFATNGLSRPYTLSADKQSIYLPHAKISLIYFVWETKLTKMTTPPPPPPRPKPEPVDNKGTIYYSYDGEGYVYIDDSVFYRCSTGKPVGYTEGGVIYAFEGDVLGFFEGYFIYDRNGYPKGAPDPKNLGTDAAGKKQVRKAEKQSLPAKGTKTAAAKPRLRNGYFGGVLQDIF